MERNEIIAKLKSIASNNEFKLTEEQQNAIQSACDIIEKATTREQWLLVLQKLGPLLVELGSRLLN